MRVKTRLGSRIFPISIDVLKFISQFYFGIFVDICLLLIYYLFYFDLISTLFRFVTPIYNNTQIDLSEQDEHIICKTCFIYLHVWSFVWLHLRMILYEIVRMCVSMFMCFLFLIFVSVLKVFALTLRYHHVIGGAEFWFHRPPLTPTVVKEYLFLDFFFILFSTRTISYNTFHRGFILRRRYVVYKISLFALSFSSLFHSSSSPFHLFSSLFHPSSSLFYPSSLILPFSFLSLVP